MSEESVQSWLNSCYYCCVSVWWGTGTGVWGSSQGQAGTGREEAENSWFQPEHPPQQSMLYPAHQPCLSNHSILLVKRQKKIKDRREKNVLSEGFRRSVRRLVLKLSQDLSVPSIAAAAQWKNHINKTSPDLLYTKASRNFQFVLLPHSCLLLHGVFFIWYDPDLKAVGATPGCAVTSFLPLLGDPVLQQQIPGSPEGNSCSR